jgi:hypothetical protein
MKRNVFHIVFAATALIIAGCSKNESTPASDSGKSPADSMKSAADSVGKAVEEKAAAAGQAVKDTAANATQAAKDAAKDAGLNAQTLIDKAKALIKDKKYEDALSSLKQLSALKLNADQQQILDDLKKQITDAMAKAKTTDAGAAVNGALGGKN